MYLLYKYRNRKLTNHDKWTYLWLMIPWILMTKEISDKTFVRLSTFTGNRVRAEKWGVLGLFFFYFLQFQYIESTLVTNRSISHVDFLISHLPFFISFCLALHVSTYSPYFFIFLHKCQYHRSYLYSVKIQRYFTTVSTGTPTQPTVVHY